MHKWFIVEQQHEYNIIMLLVKNPLKQATLDSSIKTCIQCWRERGKGKEIPSRFEVLSGRRNTKFECNKKMDGGGKFFSRFFSTLVI